jgi:DNA-binding MarR family transcriptional regulator
MSAIIETKSVEFIVDSIKKWTDSEDAAIEFQIKQSGFNTDLVLRSGGNLFYVEIEGSGSASAVNNGIEKLNSNALKFEENGVPVLAVPFMGDVGRELCAKKNISWLDFSGNANIVAKGLRIQIEGKTNKFKPLGRPKDIFAPKSSRIARQLLIDPESYITQRELTAKIKLDEGLVSRVVREMEKNGLLVRNKNGAVKVKDRNLLLDAWHEKYDFGKHEIVKGFISDRNSDFILKNLVKTLDQNNLKYAVTGLSAAWILTKFATYRTTSIYLPEMPSEDILRNVNFNKGVFDGSATVKGINCVHPIQTYLDLKGHPERAKEAAQSIRENDFAWSINL